MDLDVKELLKLRGDALIRELYRIHKSTRPFGFLKANSRDLIRMKNRNIEERNEKKKIKLLEQGRSEDFEIIPLVEEIFLHDFERMKEVKYTRFKENIFIFPYFDDRENPIFYKRTIGAKEKNRIIPGGLRVLNPNKIDYLLGICEIHFEQYKIKLNGNDERHSKNDDFKRNQFIVYVYDYEEGYWKEVKDLSKRSEDPTEPSLADIYFERKEALEVLTEVILVELESYYGYFDKIIDKTQNSKLTNNKNDVLAFLDDVSVFLNRKLMIGLMAHRISGLIDNDEIMELLEYAKVLSLKIKVVSEKIRQYVPMEVAGVGVSGIKEEKEAILEYGRLREEIQAAFRKAVEKTKDLAVIMFSGYLKSSFRKGRLYPNFAEIEARNYLKINAIKTNERLKYYEETAIKIEDLIKKNNFKINDKTRADKEQVEKMVAEIRAAEENGDKIDYFNFMSQSDIDKFYEIDEYERFDFIYSLAKERGVRNKTMFILSVFEKLSEYSSDDDFARGFEDEEMIENEEVNDELEVELDLDSLLGQRLTTKVASLSACTSHKTS